MEKMELINIHTFKYQVNKFYFKKDLLVILPLLKLQANVQ